jgi:hypothetical protein
MKDILCTVSLLLFLGVLVLVFRKMSEEGFVGGPPRCGVEYGPCSGHLKCINGFCAETAPKRVREEAPIELLPPGSPAPYF